jgi:hypothetical protein
MRRTQRRRRTIASTRREAVPVLLSAFLVTALWQMEIVFDGLRWNWDYFYFPFRVWRVDFEVARDIWYSVIICCFLALWWWGRRNV